MCKFNNRGVGCHVLSLSVRIERGISLWAMGITVYEIRPASADLVHWSPPREQVDPWTSHS